ncbi:MAG: hypothetical protein ACRDTN_01555 [Mycobacterium sp.]
MARAAKPAKLGHGQRKPPMNLTLRPYATAGVAVAGAALIAVTPVATPLPDIQVRAVQLSGSGSDLTGLADSVSQVLSDPSFVNPITEWINVLTAAGANLQTLGGIVAADPFPILSQIVTNQIGYAHTLAEGFQAAGAVLDAAHQGLPSVLEAAFHDIASGNIVGGVEDIWNGVGNFGSGGLFVAIGDVFQAIRSVAEEMASNLSNFVDTAFDGNRFDIGVVQYADTPTSPLGDQFGDIAFPVYGAAVSSTYLAQDIVNAVGAGNYVTALGDTINAPAIITGAILNGPTENFGPDDQINFAFPGSGLLTSSPIPSPLPFGPDGDTFPAEFTGGSIFDVLWARLALANALDPTAAGHTDPLNTVTGALGSSGLSGPGTVATDLSVMPNPADFTALLDSGDTVSGLSALLDPADIGGLLSSLSP